MRLGKAICILFLTALFDLQCVPDKVQQENYNKIQLDFISPTDNNTIWCYWYWIGDDISKEGITSDLEAMKEVGIGAAFIGNINPEEKDGKIPILSEEWWDHMVHAVNEGKRLGIDIGSFNCPGWSMSGGPWISSDKAMRHLVFSETSITGGKFIEEQFANFGNDFQDLYVLAIPQNNAMKNYLSFSNSEIGVVPCVDNSENLIDGNSETTVDFIHPKFRIEIQAKETINARSITLVPGKQNLIASCLLEAYVDGGYKTIRQFEFDRRDFRGQVGPIPYGPLTISFSKVVSDRFRLTCSNALEDSIKIAEIVISEEPVVEKYLSKTLGRMHPTPQPKWDSYSWGSADPYLKEIDVINEDDVLDISDKMNKEGKLLWNAPKGDWTVMRFGMIPTGVKNHPAAPQGRGYEVDKANKKLVRFHFEQFIGKFLKRIPEESKSAFKYVIADSYEMGSQNWTDDFEQSFEKKYGYNPKKYLPVFSGRVVQSVTESDRFLWDLRRAVADDIAYNYVGGLRNIANENGLKLWLENYGHWGFPSEFLMYGGQSDFVGGEFWNEGTLGDIECKAASSAAHIYGKKTTSAECFTASQRTFVRHPAMLKKRGDWSLTQGINQHVLSVYIHQPDNESIPGINAWFSTEFNRHNTWFKQGETYFEYLRRAQHMLQQGNYVADVCYFIGEDAPMMTGATIPELPKGYSFDFINAEVIIERLTVDKGKFVLPDGMSYQILVLPPLQTMRPELLNKLEQLVSEGGVIFGKAPKMSPSLQNYPQCDEQVQELASMLWAKEDKIKKYGKGAVVDGIPLQEALDYFNVQKDVEVSDEILWTHRSMKGMDIYFLTNQSNKRISISPSFRVNLLKPQLWDGITGVTRAINDYIVENERTIVPLEMESDQSFFIVFTNESNEFLNEGYVKNSPEYKTLQTINTPWQIDFGNEKFAPKSIVDGNLEDWTKSESPLLKYYSGTANYTTTFSCKKVDLKDVFIDLGEVGVIATVTLNGKEIGTTWIDPHRLSITDAIKEGENLLEIRVVNVWRNRLTGDKTLPEDERTTSVLIDNITPEEELVSSGLIGPVTIKVVE